MPFGGACGIWAIKAGDFTPTPFEGSGSGLAAAITYCGSNGLINIYPGNSLISIPTPPSGVHIFVHEESRTIRYSPSTAALTGSVRDPVLNVKDFDSFQECHDALPSSGGTIYVPAGQYTHATKPSFGSGSTPGLQITKHNVALLGEGSALTSLRNFASGAENQHSIWVNAQACQLRGFFIDHAGVAGSGRGVLWWDQDANHIDNLWVDDVQVFRSPNLSFEFFTQWADADNWVAKVRMTKCTAYDAKSGGSLYLGSAGSNNNNFEQCEFNGPGFGMYRDVTNCTVNGTTTVTAPDGSFDGINAGDELFGSGFARGTTVVSVNTAASPDSLVASNSCTVSGTPRVISFYRPSGVISSPWLPRGHVHLHRTSITRFDMCSFQGPDSSPMISSQSISNFLAMYNTYTENIVTGSPMIARIMVDNLDTLIIDGLEASLYVGSTPVRVLRVGPSGVRNGIMRNVQVVNNSADPDTSLAIELESSGSEIELQHAECVSSINGVRKPLLFTGAGAALKTVASASTMTLPGSRKAYSVTGGVTINTISARDVGCVVTLVFAVSTTVTEAGNIKLGGAYPGTAGSSLTLIYDGTSWIEIGRSIN